jgi:hypothetical protein
MSKTRRHLFHILKVSPWPLFSAMGVLFLVSGLTFYMHNIKNGAIISLVGIIVIS